MVVEPLHVPVLVGEAIAALEVKPQGRYVDGTVGAGGHAEAILGAAEDIALLGIDLDAAALETAGDRLSEYGDRVRLVHSNFGDVKAIVQEHLGSLVDGVLLDLGMSSMQVDTGKVELQLAHEVFG